MGKDFIGYDGLVEDALRGVVRTALRKVAQEGLRGPHHLYLTFRTDHPGVDLPAYLRERHPEELTIVLQHQFWALEVTEDAFSVYLNFNKAREFVGVPFAALTRFADPGAKFGLQFRADMGGHKALSRGATGDAKSGAAKRHREEEAKDAQAQDTDEAQAENIVALDAFRKK